MFWKRKPKAEKEREARVKAFERSMTDHTTCRIKLGESKHKLQQKLDELTQGKQPAFVHTIRKNHQ
jgi:hypothetical protein